MKTNLDGTDVQRDASNELSESSDTESATGNESTTSQSLSHLSSFKLSSNESSLNTELESQENFLDFQIPEFSFSSSSETLSRKRAHSDATLNLAKGITNDFGQNSNEPAPFSYDFEVLRKYISSGEVPHEPLSPFLDESVYQENTDFSAKKFSTLNWNYEYRFMLSTPTAGVVRGSDLRSLRKNSLDLEDMIKTKNFWLDVMSPTTSEMKVISKIFHLHPLTMGDIMTEQSRDKCEYHKDYYFMCIRTFEADPNHPSFMRPINVYTVVLADGILSFHLQPTPHQENVLSRIRKSTTLLSCTPDWINYALMDDILRCIGPVYSNIEKEAEEIDSMILGGNKIELNAMLKKMGYARKNILNLLRLTSPKTDALNSLVKRFSDKKTECETSLYLHDVQDNLLTIVQNLNHMELMLSRSHANYLAQVSIEMNESTTGTNILMIRLSVVAFILFPINIVTGIWGMNVPVPGEQSTDLTWFFSIILALIIFILSITLLCRRWGYL